MPAVSIVIPYFNIDENLVKKCLKSLINQTFKDIEIIIINDGSNQSKTFYIESTIKIDNRIRYYYQENKGVSSTRNKGIQLAKGEYIAFVDADDTVVPEYIEQAYKFAKFYNADFVIGGSCLIDSNGNKVIEKHKNINFFGNIEIYDGKINEKLCSYFISSNVLSFKNGHFGRGPVSRLVRTSLARNALFPINVSYGEDIIWNQKLFSLCDKVVLVPRVWYMYVTNNTSVTQGYNKNSIESAELQLNILHRLLAPCKGKIYYEFVNREFEIIYGQIFNQYLINKECNIRFFKRIKIFNQLENREPWNLITSEYLNYASIKEKIIYYAYKTRTLFLLVYMYKKIRKNSISK